MLNIYLNNDYAPWNADKDGGKKTDPPYGQYDDNVGTYAKLE